MKNEATMFFFIATSTIIIFLKKKKNCTRYFLWACDFLIESVYTNLNLS